MASKKENTTTTRVERFTKKLSPIGLLPPECPETGGKKKKV